MKLKQSLNSCNNFLFDMPLFLTSFSTPFRLCMCVLNMNIIHQTDINIYIRSFRQISSIAGYCKVCRRM
jgi:hypothetical protein